MNPRDYAQLLYEVLENKTDEQQSQILERFKDILTKNKDTHLSGAISKELKKIQEEKIQEKTTYIASASEFSAAQKQELENLLPEPRIFSENPFLLGGVAVRQKDRIYNATLKKQIEALRNIF